jgi:hypothetical protein
MADEPKWWKTIERVIALRELYLFLMEVCGGAAFAAYLTSHLFPTEWDTQTKLYAGVAALSGGIVGTRYAILGVKRLWNIGTAHLREKPRLVVAAHSGAEALLEVTNTGGTATVWAEGHIVDVSKGNIRHQAPYLMLWKNREQDNLGREHRKALSSGNPAFLSVASFRSVPGRSGTADYLCITGNQGHVDSFSFDHRSEDSPLVSLRISFFAEPELTTALECHYDLGVIRKSGVVELLPPEPAKGLGVER